MLENHKCDKDIIMISTRRCFFQTLLIFIVVLGIAGPLRAMEKKPLSQEEILEQLFEIVLTNSSTYDSGNRCWNDDQCCLDDDNYKKFKDIITRLKNPGAIEEAEGCNLLHLAAQYGRYRTVKLLIDLDVEMESEDGTTGATALHMACDFGHYAVARLLLERGANPDATFGSDKRTPLKLAQ